MEKQVSFHVFYVLICLICVSTESGAAKELQKNRYYRPDHKHGSVMKRLFVFGDSYADTGNWEKTASSWREPYGITFPGKPSGRFSDGRVFTDYLASYLGIKSPVPYQQRKRAKKSDIQYGMNFAYGGIGVFDTLNNAPNLTTQINFFQHLLEENNAYNTSQHLNSSIAFVSIAGNDYTAFLYKNGHLKELSNFTKALVNQLAVDLKRIHGLGVPKIAVTSLQPIGCLPELVASSSYQNCSESWNDASMFHNYMLQEVVQNLNSETQNNAFQVLDLFSAFMSAFKDARSTGRLNDESPLKPCCRGVTSEYSCGNIDKNGVKKYDVCNNPESRVFWDTVHPCQNGWRHVYLALQSSLHQLNQ